LLPFLKLFIPRILLLLICLGLSATNYAQNQPLSVQQKDAMYLSSNWKDLWKKWQLKRTYVQMSLQYSVENTNTTKYQSPFIYPSKYEQAFPLGAKMGASWDFMYNQKSNWTLSTHVNYLSSKTKQAQTIQLSPLIETYYAFPFKSSSWFAGIQLLYKMPLFKTNNEIGTIYWAIGPGFDLQISPQNIDQQQYKKANYYFITGNTGLEYSLQNRKWMGLYYQYGNNAIKSQIKTQLAAWQISLFIPIQKKS
jgi:hypothetical protein